MVSDSYAVLVAITIIEFPDVGAKRHLDTFLYADPTTVQHFGLNSIVSEARLGWRGGVGGHYRECGWGIDDAYDGAICDTRTNPIFFTSSIY